MQYVEAKERSRAFDLSLGLNTELVENSIAPREGFQNWAGFSPEVFQTPYAELKHLLEELNLSETDTIVDLGAGYGRLGSALLLLNSKARFVGFELEEARVNAGLAAWHRLRIRLIESCTSEADRLELLAQDLCAPDFELPGATHYFIYDFGTKPQIREILERLKAVAQIQKITVIGRGRASRDLIEQEHPWLSQVIDPIHYSHYSIYQSQA